MATTSLQKDKTETTYSSFGSLDKTQSSQRIFWVWHETIFSPGALGNTEYPFIAFIPWSTPRERMPVSVLSMHQIDLWANHFYSIRILDSICKKKTKNKKKKTQNYLKKKEKKKKLNMNVQWTRFPNLLL